MTSSTSISPGRRRILYTLLLSACLLLPSTSKATAAAFVIPQSPQAQADNTPTPEPPPKQETPPTPQPPMEFPSLDNNLPRCPAEKLPAGVPPPAKGEHLQAVLAVAGPVKFQCQNGRYVEVEPSLYNSVDSGLKLYNFGDVLKQHTGGTTLMTATGSGPLELDQQDLGPEIGLYRYGVVNSASGKGRKGTTTASARPNTGGPWKANIQHHFYLQRAGFQPHGRSRDSERRPGHPHPMRWDRLFTGMETHTVKTPSDLLLDQSAAIQPEPAKMGNPNDKVRAYRVLQRYGENVANQPCRKWGYVFTQNTIDVDYRALFYLYGPQQRGLISARMTDRIDPVCKPDTVTTERGQKRPG